VSERDELEVLRAVFVAAQAWQRTKYAMHTNTSESTRRWMEAVRYAEGHLRDKVEEALRAFADPFDEHTRMWSDEIAAAGAKCQQLRRCFADVHDIGCPMWGTS
jgi:hypothetical protein